ncbi:hypothetical protein DL93DRAFT_2063547 [Clavulina sp. PMI_390]|nr:hypothetical protein DL93DRAFT_2063547 [Clavulina sp. PMI_390]
MKQLDDAIALMGKTGSGPKPADPFVAQAWIMSNIHAIILGALRHIYLVRPTIQQQDHVDFVGYALYWVELLDFHHHLEETWTFPHLKAALPIDVIEAEHAAVHPPLEAMKDYLLNCLPAGATWGAFKKPIPADSKNHPFDAAKLNSLIDAVVPAFVPHFCNEIGYLDATKLRASVTHDDLKAMFNTLFPELMKLVRQPKGFFVYEYLHTRSYDYPMAPWFVSKFLIPWVFYWQDRRFWRFAPQRVFWDN